MRRFARLCLIALISYLSSGVTADVLLPEYYINLNQDPGQDQIKRKIIDLTNRIDLLYQQDDIRNGLLLSDSLNILFRMLDDDPGKDFSKTLYFLGVWENGKGNSIAALKYLDRAMAILATSYDPKTEARILRFKGILYSEIQDYYEAEKWQAMRLRLVKNQQPQDINDIIESIIYLSGAKISLRNYSEAEALLGEGFSILKNDKGAATAWNRFYLYYTRASLFIELSDYRRAIQDLNKALDLAGEMTDDGRARLHSLFGISYFYSGEYGKCKSHYISAIEYSSENPQLYINVCSGYATVLGEIGDAASGERVLAMALERIGSNRDILENDYYALLHYYAEFLRDYEIDIPGSLKLNLECYRYLSGKPKNFLSRQSVLLSYSLGLSQMGNHEESLDSINSLLKRNVRAFSRLSGRFENPDYSVLEPDKRLWYLLVARYKIIRNYYRKTGDMSALEAASEAAGLAALIMERIKGNIGEEESRIFAGNRYRQVYIDAIDLNAQLYAATGSKRYLEKAFGFSERSKASGLLASTREVRALKYSVPQELVDLDNSIAYQIGLCKARLAAEEAREIPNRDLLKYWNNQLFAASEKKDSLEKEMERKYPDYSRMKSDTSIIRTSDIDLLTSGRKNFVSYVIADTSLYIFLINSKNRELIRRDIDDSFFSKIAEFRHLLSEPDRSTGNARDEYLRFRELGRYLYMQLIDPVNEMFISEKLIISPDNMLAYFPFDILLTSGEGSDDIYYSTLPYMMRNFSISYAYSATLLGETEKTRSSFRNRSVSFAPSYRGTISVRDLLLSSSQSSDDYLSELRFAREEAFFVSEVTNGTLFTDDMASEAAFLREAPSNDIIHLAMHTLLDVRNNINSRMIFSEMPDSSGDGNLYTYEINSLELDAKMVVLSSCFTGSGALFAGEGVLSLARAFLYSGSRSVVMSLWEVNDRSGTDIVKSFYTFLKSGNSKSNSLRKARLKYLEESDQLQSHPYFWATMVVYGDDSPVYLSIQVVAAILIAIVLLIAGTLFYYFRKR